ncbi:DNA phosphorothioation system restriction enzyme [Roseofilum sp. Guam]|uniref:DNA phosphorothioation system restriction enzyme n=1 Tax=Roseofilum sp. Guam TaxID=2821502 RepID=UPI001B0FAF3E|nr:DNA phosphorothioation system restriction enzyme [Roseofilum sp. Guam]MBP0029695.1 DNA phosphorothioation system restriction enzyme [Roseofilum sp. Guam]
MFPCIPDSIQLRPYQQQAVTNWFAHQGRGTLKMATGSGKTITALAIAVQLYQCIGLQALIVVCPYRHLVAQWGRECERFGMLPILAFERVRHWQHELSTQLYNVQVQKQVFLCVITTNSTLLGDGFQSQLAYFPSKTLIVGDEAHNLGTAKLEESLPAHVGLRLALSATPERFFDRTGTEAIFNYFGPIIPPELTLKDAIDQGALVHYLYYPVLVHLTESEAYKYAKLTTRIGWALAAGEKLEENETLTALLIRRSRLIANAENKLDKLRTIMQPRLQTSHTLFYCGDGAQEGKTSDSSDRQIAAVTRLLGVELGYRVNTYTANTSLSAREALRHQFEQGELQGLIAMRCLDEGVDIPAIKTAIILASSRNPRQFIQRRGRILRPHPHKQRATLFDLIVVPPPLDRQTWDVERNLLRKELQRFVEFADLADNAGEARGQLLGLQKEYGLLDL